MSLLVLSCSIVACGLETKDPPPVTTDPETTFAVVLSDYTSTSIGLLNADLDVVTQRWIDSGSTIPGLVAALSGDVALASRHPGGVINILDRFGTDVLSRVRLEDRAVLGQVRTHDDSLEDGYTSNPQDFVLLDDGTAWVSRLAGNPNPDAADINKGTDLLEIDPVSFTRTGERIDLSVLNATVTVQLDTGPVDKTAYAGPSRMVVAQGKIAVGLTGLTLSFDGAAPGAVGIVDPSDGSVTSAPLPQMANCGRIVAVPGDDDLVMVGCIGFSRPFGDQAQIRASSGIATVRVSDGSVVSTWRPADDAERPLAVGDVIPLGPDRALAVALGGSDRPDRAYEVNLSTGETTQLFESDGAFEIGPGAYDPTSGFVVVPDASAGIRVLSTVAGTFGLVDTIAIGAALGLPARAAYVVKE